MATSSVLGACKSSSRERVKEPLGRRLTPFALEDRRPEQTHGVLKVQTSRSVSVAGRRFPLPPERLAGP